MQPPSHIDDDALSAFVDQELSPDDLARASSHLETCSECQERLDGLFSVASLLRQLPDLEPPRDFALGPRLLGDPPNVARLQRWYTAARASAAALAAAFAFLLAGTLYLSAQPAAPAASSGARPAVLSAPATSAPAAARSGAAAAPAQAPAPLAPAPPAAGQASAVSAHPATVSPQSDDQVAAETTVSPLPTPLPPPVPTVAAAPVAAAVATAESGPGAVLGLGALVVGILAIVALLIALVVRHRLQRASTA
jgi:hypothetical protein